MKMAPRGHFHLRLDDACFLESSVRSVLLHVAHTLSGNINEDRGPELSDVNTTLLEVRLATDLSGRIELSSTRTV